MLINFSEESDFKNQDGSHLNVFILELLCALYRSKFSMYCHETFIQPWSRSGHVLISFSEKSDFKIQDGGRFKFLLENMIQVKPLDEAS